MPHPKRTIPRPGQLNGTARIDEVRIAGDTENGRAAAASLNEATERLRRERGE